MSEHAETPVPSTRPDLRPPTQEPRPAAKPVQPAGEVNGPRGPEPTRFGDWEKNGRCSDF